METSGGIDSAILILVLIVLVVASAFAFYRLKKRAAKAKAASLKAESGLKASLELVKEQATQRQLSPEEIERRAKVAAAWEAETAMVKPKPYGHFSNISEPIVQPPLMTGSPMSEPFAQPAPSPFGVPTPPAAPVNPFDELDELAYDAGMQQAQMPAAPFGAAIPETDLGYAQPSTGLPSQPPAGLPVNPMGGALPSQPVSGLPSQPPADAFPITPPVQVVPVVPVEPVYSEVTEAGQEIARMLSELAVSVNELAASGMDDRSKADQITLLLARKWAELPLYKLN